MLMLLKDIIDVIKSHYREHDNDLLEVIVYQIEELSSNSRDCKYTSMKEDEFEDWLREHGICNPYYNGTIACDMVPMLIDDAIAETVQASQSNEADEIYDMMKEYYFAHRDEKDDGWQGGFGKCMNLIPNVYKKMKLKGSRWIINIDSDGWNDWVDCTCPKCGETFKKFEPTNYCPNCGKRLRTDV